MAVPAHVRRLFPDYDSRDLDAERYADFLTERLLEEGDSADLRWLTATCSEERIADWLCRHGGRRLSGRSRALWEALLGVGVPAPAGGAAEVWRE
jgi:hypothetical protein